MQAPKRRTSSSKSNMRRAHDALKPVNPISCANCGEPLMPHRICRHCGVYRGREMAPDARNRRGEAAVKIALDAMGGDLAPKATVEGAVRPPATSESRVVMVGDGEILAHELADHGRQGLPITNRARARSRADGRLAARIAIVQAVTRRFTSDSNWSSAAAPRAFVSAGNSGAVMTASMMILGDSARRRSAGDRIAGADQRGIRLVDRRGREHRSEADQPRAVRA